LVGDNALLFQVRLHKGQEWRTQECFVTGQLAHLPHDADGMFYEAEIVYIHVLRMVAMAIDDEYQVEIKRLSAIHNGQYRGVPPKGVARMWNKLQVSTHTYMHTYMCVCVFHMVVYGLYVNKYAYL
jgi:hypothetical protein